MTVRDQLHELIDHLPENALSEALDRLAALCPKDDVWAVLGHAPREDEQLSTPELEALRRHGSGSGSFTELSEDGIVALLSRHPA